MNQETLRELFIDHIRDLYDAEKQIVNALPKLAKAADSEELAEALHSHLEESQGHVTRLENAFKVVGAPVKGKTCKGIQGLLEEGSEAVRQTEDLVLRDLALIAGCQKVEHYEMSAYGTARVLAEQMGMEDVVELLQQTEDEELNADQTLTMIAISLYESSAQEDAGEDEVEEKTAAMGATQPTNEPASKNAA